MFRIFSECSAEFNLTEKDFMCRLYNAVILSICVCCSAIVNAQTNCQYTFEANAGPDIHVCEGGQVLLTAEVGGGVNDIYWRGGKGQFLPDRKSAAIEYIPDSSEVGTTVVLTLVAKRNDSECPPVRDEIAIAVDKILQVEAGDQVELCPGGRVDLDGRVLRGEWGSITWKSSGTGSFQDQHALNAVYFPSEQDALQGGCALRMVVSSAGVCLPDSDALAVQIIKVPSFTLSDTIFAKTGESIDLQIKPSGSPDEILWMADGDGDFENPESAKTSYKPGALDINNKKVVVTCSVAYKGCTKSVSTIVIIQ